MPSKKQKFSYALGDQSHNEDYPKILLEFLNGTRTIDNPNMIKLAKIHKGSSYREYLSLLSQTNPIGVFMLTYRLSYKTIRDFLSQHPAFKKAFQQANTGSLNNTHTAYFFGAIDKYQYASMLHVNHGITLGASSPKQLSLPPQPQQITVTST